MTFPVVYTPEPKRPAGGPEKGTRVLLGWIVSPAGWDAADAHDDQDPTNLGIYNPRDVCGNPWPHWKCTGSQHARGAAGDAGFPVVLPGGHPEGHKLAGWLVAEHEALGVQEVIFAEQRWSNQTMEWRPYHGKSKHYDHVHFAQNDAGAKGLTLAMIQAVAPQPPEEPVDWDKLREVVREEIDASLVSRGIVAETDTKPGGFGGEVRRNLRRDCAASGVPAAEIEH